MQTPEELRTDARRLIEASKRSSDQKRKNRYAERAFELAQLAEELSRRDYDRRTAHGDGTHG